LISNIVTGAMWPLVVLILGITFRKTLRSVLERVTNFEGLGAKLEFGESVKRLDEAADSVEIESASGKSSDDGSSRDLPLRHLVAVARISPAAAVVDAWREVEALLLKYWQAVRRAQDLPEERRLTPGRLLHVLQGTNSLSPPQVHLLEELRTTRNAVAHGKSQPSEGQSLAYVDAAALAIQSLETETATVLRSLENAETLFSAEFPIGTDPTYADSDADGLSDELEKAIDQNRPTNP
jgi:hypothetical protein